jgi:cytochrome oxidase Cu insertion factor (SCO1/SenC/PrrC family)
MMVAEMRSVASALLPGAAAEATMLMVTPDPANDRTPQLLQYAKNQEPPNKGWILANGSEDRIKPLIRVYWVTHEAQMTP